jgi:flagellar biosynthetic protein FliR
MDALTQAALTLTGHVPVFLMVLVRMMGLFIVSPLLSATHLPPRVKIFLALMLSAAIFPLVSQDVQAPLTLDLPGLLVLLVREAALGYVMGLVAAAPLLFLEASGMLAGHQMGLGLARVYNPEADIDADIIGQLLYYVGAGVFLAFNGVEILIASMVDSFGILPMGGFSPGMSVVQTLLAIISTGADVALRVSAPASGSILLVVIVLGVLGKTAPQLNAMTIGFIIKILVGIAVLAFSLYAVREAAESQIQASLQQASSIPSQIVAEPRREQGD